MIASIIWAPWWLTWGLAIVFLFIFPSYYEILLWGVAYDSLYGLPLPQFWNFPYIFSLSSAILFVISIYLRKLLLAYEPQI
jgi:hypothetical protein